MTITVGENSYVTIQEADDYFADKYGYDKWSTEPNKEGALISAAQQLDIRCTWFDSPVAADQAMAFPRTPGANPTPQNIKDAQCEIAYRIVDTGSTQTNSGDPLTELKAGSVTLKFKASSSSNPLINDLTSNLLSPYGLCSGGSTKLIPIERQ